jgi:KUP system potassium uptake protein
MPSNISPAAVSTPAAAARPAGVALLLGTLGVVFGDIGTSPIYAFRETLRAAGAEGNAAAALPEAVFGVLSLNSSGR